MPPFFTHLHTIVEDFRRNVLVLINERDTFTPQRYDGGTIDIWWQSSAGGSLMTILAYLVQLDRNWRKSVLRIFLPMDREKERKIRKVLDAARIEAELVRSRRMPSSGSWFPVIRPERNWSSSSSPTTAPPTSGVSALRIS